MRDVSNGWLIRYLHGAPCDDYSGKMWDTDKFPLLLRILPSTLITAGIGMQLVDSRLDGLPRQNEIRGRVHDEAYKLDTSGRAQYSLLVQSRICRPESFIYDPVRGTGPNIGINDVNFIKNKYWCKHLNTQQAWIHKPWELTAYAAGLLASTRSRNPRSSLTAKGDSLSKLYFSSASKHTGTLGPDSPKGERPTVPVSSWLRDRIDDQPRVDGRIRNLIDIISYPEFLFASYEFIKSKKGNMTPCVDKKTKDGGVDWEFWETFAGFIQKGQFDFSPSRRVIIPKAGGGKRPLCFGPPRDKIVQKAIAQVLETIYEPLFRNNSLGFRPQRSVHMALKELYLKGGSYAWAINGDISACFPPNNVIMRLLGKKITCKRTLEIIHKSLKAKVVDEKVKVEIGGRPQGSVMSPILSNIVLHELDTYVEGYKARFEIGKSRRVNRKYHHSQNTVRHLLLSREIRARNLSALLKKHHETPDQKRRLLYVRYADDFVILLISSLEEAYSLRRALRDFLKDKLGLELNMDKTSIVNTRDGFEFLGASVSKVQQIITRTKRRNHSIKPIVRKRVNRRLVVCAPMTRIITKLIKNKFARRNHLNQVLARGRKDLVNHTHYDIIRFYNSRIRGILNFYSFAANYSSLRSIVWMFTLSCALTLALKHKLKTARKAFGKFGRYLEDPETGEQVYHEVNMKVKHDYKISSLCVTELDKKLEGSLLSYPLH